MNKLAIIPIFFLTMCGTAPVVDPPAHACSLPLDGSSANCPDERDLILIPREQAKGEVDVWNINHWHQLQMMFERNINKGKIEQQATKPSESIDKALFEFYNNPIDSDQ